MADFRYIAKTLEGETNSGTLEAPGLREALEQLRSRDLFVVSIREQGALLLPQQFSLATFLERLQERKPKSRDFMIFCRQFATMLQAGITVLQVLRIQAQQSENLSMRKRLREVSLDVERGGDLAGALEKHGDFFPRIIVSMIAAGEAGGILDAVMERLALHFQNQHDLEEKVRTATMYPLVVAALAVGVMGLMLFFVLPQFSKIFESVGVEMPLLTRAMLGLSSLLTRYWYLLAALIILPAAALLRYMRTPRGREFFDKLQLRLPIYGKIYGIMIVARFARTLGTLLASGVALIPALELVEKVINNVVLAGALSEARRVIRQGRALAMPLATCGLFPPMMVEMVHIGEESGALDGMLTRTAEFYESELTFILDRLSSVIEPVLLVGVGALVALLLISLMSPMLKMYQSF